MASCSTGGVDSDSITVFAAASLTDVFSEIGDAFESERPGMSVEFSFASSSDLARQIVEGAPVDVFASADIQNIDAVRNSGLRVRDVRTFATNELEIMVEPGNPKGIDSLEDLSDPSIVFVTCDVSVPIGRYSAQILSMANVRVTPASYEESVKGIVNKVLLGEADAGIVYRTDVIAAGSSATGVSIPDEFEVVASYQVTAIGNQLTSGTLAFVDFLVTSPTARSILATYGFGPP